MVKSVSDPGRQPAQAKLIEQAVAGDPGAIQNVLNYLNSANPDLRRLMQAALHGADNPEAWRRLMDCLAFGCWESEPGEEISRSRGSLSNQTAQTISEAFVIDESPAEGEIKDAVLAAGLGSAEQHEQYSAAYLLGLRGDLRALGILEQMVDSGELTWQLRAIQALEALDDGACGPALVKGLASGRREVHLAAGRGLGRLGEKAEPALMAALHHPDDHVRWHAARGLGQIGNLRAVEVLVDGLCDENQEVRWATARVLANLDTPAIPAILSLLCRQPMSEPLRQAAFHALNSMPSLQRQETRGHFSGLLNVLGHQDTAVEAPGIANKLLSEWKNGGATEDSKEKKVVVG